MKNLKKVLAFVVVFAMMFTCSVSASPFADVADNASYAEAVTILSSLGLMIGDDNGNFNPDKTITRAEATAVVVRAKGLEDAAKGAAGATAFPDVPANHWATGYINLASQSKMIVGYPDGTFGPEDEVTYDQIVKIIIAAMGYTPKADTLGGYPTGYLVIATQEGVTKGATGNAGEPAPRSVVARLLFNALEVKTMEQTVYTKGAEEYEPTGAPLLASLNVRKGEGVVTATPSSQSSISKDNTRIIIDLKDIKGLDSRIDTEAGDNNPEIGDTDAAAYLGYYVTAYITDDEDTGNATLVAIAPKSGKNETITLDYSQLEPTTTNNGNTVINYTVNNDDRDLELASNAKYFLNGVGCSASNVSNFLNGKTTKGGVVTFIKNDSTKDQYNVVMVTEYGDNYVVGEISGVKLFDLDGQRIAKIRIDDEDRLYTFYNADGTVASFEDIEVEDVLTIADGKNGSYAVYISKNVVEGTVTEKTSDEDAYYRIDGNLYRLVTDNGPTLRTGDEGKFYLNVDNRVVYKDVTAGTSAGTYAYMYAADLTESFNQKKVEAKFYTLDGEWMTAYVAEDVTLFVGGDRKNVKSASADLDALYTINGDKVAVHPQLFKYQLNSAGEINRIHIAVRGEAEDYFTMKAGTNSDKFDADNMKLGSVYVKSDAKVLFVPSDNKESSYTVSTVAKALNDELAYTGVTFYDISTEGYPQVIVADKQAGVIDAATRLFVLTSIASGTDAAGNEIDKFYGYQAGEAVEAVSNYDTAVTVSGCGKTKVSELEAGDAVVFSLDATGAIDNIEVVMSAANAKAAKAAMASIKADATDAEKIAALKDATFYNSKIETLYDKTVENVFGFAGKKQSGNRLTIDRFDDATTLTVRGNYDVYEVNINRTNPVVTVSEYGDIEVENDKGNNGDWVYVRTYDGSVVDIVVYTFTNTVDVPAL